MQGMYRPLVPCPDCHRHVRTTEARCPFCEASLPDDLPARVVPGAPHRLSRAAAFAFTASLAVAACPGGGGDLPEGSTSSGGSSSGGSSSGGSSGTASDGGGNQALYGMPAPPDDGGSVGAKYGAPALPDGG